jgi:hypothetical protein
MFEHFADCQANKTKRSDFAKLLVWHHDCFSTVSTSILSAFLLEADVKFPSGRLISNLK